jgi:hypothetical protein
MDPEVRKPEVSRMQPPTPPSTLETGLYARLWEGRSLAVTLAWISVLASLALFLAARRAGRR